VTQMTFPVTPAPSKASFLEFISKQLVEIAKQLDAGHLRAFVKTTVPLNEVSSAYSGAVAHKGGYGKIVIAVSM